MQRPGNGLTRWRQRKAEEKEAMVAELDVYRATATTEVRDGRTFRIVRIPDRYEFKRTR
jgi:hypothetical protein